ncbi:MAG TPA: hypothetical protein VMH81_26895 [Bryobacteraceae bacterium]|nr:hypothetical protein [Bryobacteraceae bacterium]
MKADTTKISAMGLDVGTSRIVTARQAADQSIKYDSQLNAFVTIPYSKMTENVLRKESVSYSVDGEEIVVHGNEAERFADLLKKETRRTMARGILNSGEPDGLKIIRAITTTLAGKAEKGQKLCFTVPAAPMGAEENLTYHEVTIRDILTGLGYEVQSINEGLAVVYSELESSNYTGIGISCGGGLCNVCFAYLSVPIVSFSIPKAGDFIDSSAASVMGERANRVRILKEQSFYMNGNFEDKLKQVLVVYYDDMIQTLVTALRNAFLGSRNMPKLSRPIPLVLSGGTAMPKGFRERFEKILGDTEFPVDVSEIRMASDPLTSTAKGALVAALSEM